MGSFKRGVGYCENVHCSDYLKGVFLLNQDTFSCPKCRVPGLIEMEKQKYLNKFPVLREVRVEFDYDPTRKKYKQIAVVYDSELSHKCNTLTIFSPLVKTEKRALKLAEQFFATISMIGMHKRKVESRENVISWDSSREKIAAQCRQLSSQWERSAKLREKGMNCIE